MTRREGWELRLVAEIEGARARAWEWGAHDCATFAAGCLTAQFGFPPLIWERFAGRWSTKAGAALVLRREGFADIAAALDSVSGRLARPVLAGRGDLVSAPGARGAALGIVEGGAGWFAAERGLARLPLPACDAAWPAAGLY